MPCATNHISLILQLNEAIELVQELKVPTAYFTHIGHQLNKHAAVNKDLPPGIALAYDGLVLNFE